MGGLGRVLGRLGGDVVGRCVSQGRQGNLLLGRVDAYSEPLGFGKDFFEIVNEMGHRTQDAHRFRTPRGSEGVPIAELTQEENVTEWG